MFYERITVTTSGVAGNVITLQGTRGAGGEHLTIIDGSDALNGGWTLAASTYGGLYQRSSLPYEVGWMGVDDGTTTYHILSSKLRYENRTYFDIMDLPANYKAAKSYLTGQKSFTGMALRPSGQVERLQCMCGGETVIIPTVKICVSPLAMEP